MSKHGDWNPGHVIKKSYRIRGSGLRHYTAICGKGWPLNEVRHGGRHFDSRHDCQACARIVAAKVFEFLFGTKKTRRTRALPGHTARVP